MKKFICLAFIPVITGVLTGLNGASYFVPEQLGLALMINIPVCMLATAINTFTK
jgi:hypothetical protein